MIAMKRDSGSPVSRLIWMNTAMSTKLYARIQNFQRRLNARVHDKPKNMHVAARISQCKTGSRRVDAECALIVREVRQQHEDSERAAELQYAQRLLVILGPDEFRSDAAKPGMRQPG